VVEVVVSTVVGTGSGITVVVTGSAVVPTSPLFETSAPTVHADRTTPNRSNGASLTAGPRPIPPGLDHEGFIAGIHTIEKEDEATIYLLE
jgi:hypothetical protein